MLSKLRWPRRRTRLLVYYLLTVLGVLLTYAAVYRSFMMWFEGRERDFLSALQMVVQTVTTVGYGEDAPWHTPQLNALVIAMQLTGLVTLFMLFPLFVLPWLEERLKWRWIPTQAPRRMRGHVIICGYSPLAETLARELRLAGRPVLFVVREAELAARLEARWPAIHADVSHVHDLRRAGAQSARALVANESDERNAAMILSASAFAQLYVLAVAGNSRAKAYLSYAGADVVVSPRESTALALTDKALTGSPFHLEDLAHVAPSLEVAELPVLPGSSLIGRTLGDAELGEQTGVKVIGVWAKGDFVFSPGPATGIDEGSVLVAAGSRRQLEELEELTLSSRWRAADQEGGRVLILGCEEVALAVRAGLTEKAVDAVLVEAGTGREQRGEELEEALQAAGIDRAGTVIVALEDDVRTTYAVLLARRLNPDVQLVACATEEDMVPRMYQAGAHYVLALAVVGGRALAAHLLGRELLAFGKQIRIERMPVGRMAGHSVGELRVRSRTGCTVLAVERSGEAFVEIDPDFPLQEGDVLVLSGSDQNLQRFHRQYSL